VPLFVIPVFSGDRKGDAEMPECHLLIVPRKKISVSVFRRDNNDDVNSEMADTAEWFRSS